MNKQTNQKTCYMCENIATTTEHIPPKVFFPEKKGSISIDYRKNLMTVPSCEEHNLGKSDDDEYIFMLILSSYKNNPIAQDHFKKVIRAIDKKPSKGKVFLNQPLSIMFDNQFTIAPKIDIDRFESFFDHLSRGLYYYQFQEKWNATLRIIPLSLFYDPREFDWQIYRDRLISLTQTVYLLFSNQKKYGENQKIFYYQIFEDEESNEKIMRMVFYEGFEVITSEY